MPLSEHAVVSLVVAALMGKYNGYSQQCLRAACEQAWTCIAPLCPAAARGACSAVEDVHSDIRNQLVTLRLMDESSPGGEEPVRTLHRQLFGYGDPGGSLRRTNTLADFTDTLRVDTLQVAARLDELEQLIRVMALPMGRASPATQAYFVAYVFAAVIRIHPFADGNGRVARMLVQQLRRWWGQPLLLIPKVRNSDIWKHAILQAIDGHFEDLVSCLAAAEELC